MVMPYGLDKVTEAVETAVVSLKAEVSDGSVSRPTYAE